MVKIKIGYQEQELKDAEEHWINEQINNRRKDKQPVCIQITIKEAPLNITLRTGDCTGTGGGGRPPNPQEKDIFDLWDKRGLNESDFPIGHLVAFIKQLRKLLN